MSSDRDCIEFSDSDDDTFGAPGQHLHVWDDVRDLTLLLGKYKGSTMSEMIATRRTRGYLRYLLKWDELNAFTSRMITISLEYYLTTKLARVSPMPPMLSLQRETTTKSFESDGDSDKENIPPVKARSKRKRR